MSSNEANSAGDPVSTELVTILARLTELADAATDPNSEAAADGGAAWIDRITVLERMRSTLAAAQQTAMVAFARAQVEAQSTQVTEGRLDPRKIGAGIGDQVGLAAHVSPFVGSRRLGVARALAADLPATRAQLVAGQITETLAEFVVAETSHLDPEQRRLVDKQLVEDALEGQGRRQAEATVKKRAYEIDRAGYTGRGRKARKDRRVTLRPAPDTMSVLSVLLPVEQGVACVAALRKHADALIGTGDSAGRTRDQVMTDTLVERVTGQKAATDVPVEVGIVLPLDTLIDPDSPATGELVGHGPLPGPIVRDLLATSQGKKWWRRLFTHPVNGTLVGGDAKKRDFDGVLKKLIGLRDHGRCRDCYCGAPIRHTDHIRQSRAGGPASFTNGRGVCARGNYVREIPDWTVEVVADGLGDEPHTVRTTTPTGHTYTSRAGP